MEITNHLLNRKDLKRGSPEYGIAFEQFVMQELFAYCSYHGRRPGLSYWRTASGYAVDAALGDAHVAIEIKSAREIHSHHIKGLKAFGEEHPDSRRKVVSNEPNSRIMGDIEIFPISEFLRKLWSGSVFAGNFDNCYGYKVQVIHQELSPTLPREIESWNVIIIYQVSHPVPADIG